jgi:hypothetical protein
MIHLPEMNANEEKMKKVEKYDYRIIPNTFFSQNEIYISSIVLNIPEYRRFFSPILSVNKVNVGDEDLYSDYLLIKKRHFNIQCTTFHQLFYQDKKHPKIYVLNTIQIIRHLFETVKRMNTFSLINLNPHPTNLNILYDGEVIPIYTKLDQFFYSKTNDIERKSIIFSTYNHLNVFLTIEAHTICYLIDKKYTSLSTENIEEIVKNYHATITSLCLFEKEFIEQLKERISIKWRRFINRHYSEIIKDLLATSTYWNLYGVSIFFLIFLRDQFNLNDRSCLFLRRVFLLLQKNIDFQEERITVEQNILTFDNILYSLSREDWYQLFGTRALFNATAR